MKTDKLILVLVLIISQIMALMWIHNGHSWGGDFSMYIAQAKSIIEGSLDELYELNKYSMVNSQYIIGPYLYPNGFPLLLSPIYLFFGIDFIVMKLFCSLFFILSLPLIYFLLKSYFNNSIYSLFIIVMIAFHQYFLSFSDNILSDFPFLFFSVLTIFLFKKSNNFLHQVFLGILIYFTYSIRDIGIVLIPSLIIYQVQEIFCAKVINRKQKSFYLIPHITFILLFITLFVFFPKTGGDHYDLILNQSLGLMYDNIIYYGHLISAYLLGNTVSSKIIDIPLFWIFPLFIVFVGLIIEKNNLHIVIYTTFIMVIYVLWPAVQGIRFLFPVIPFILYFFVNGINFFTNKFNIKFLNIIILILFSVNIIYEGSKSTLYWSRFDTNTAYTPEMKEIYSFISNTVPENEIIVFFKPRVLRLFTERNSISLKDYNESKDNFILLKKGINVSIYETIFETDNYETIFETDNYVLYQKIPIEIISIKK